MFQKFLMAVAVSLGAHPAGVSGTGPYTLTWGSGEMRNGATVGHYVTPEFAR